MNNTFYNYKARDLKGNEVSMETYRGKTVIVVNTASKCGFTPQYGELQQLYDLYKDRGLEILGFPCNQFAHQEPGDSEAIGQFCSINYGVSFPMFEKIEVNGSSAHPLFKYLTQALPGTLGKRVKWNFTKFLIGPDGKPVKRFAPSESPLSMGVLIEELLKKNNGTADS